MEISGGLNEETAAEYFSDLSVGRGSVPGIATGVCLLYPDSKDAPFATGHSQLGVRCLGLSYRGLPRCGRCLRFRGEHVDVLSFGGLTHGYDVLDFSLKVVG